MFILVHEIRCTEGRFLLFVNTHTHTHIHIFIGLCYVILTITFYNSCCFLATRCLRGRHFMNVIIQLEEIVCYESVTWYFL